MNKRHSLLLILRFHLLLYLCGMMAESLFAGVFSHLDINMDGVLSGKEVVGLKVLDKDRDGEVSAEEFQNAVLKHAKALPAVDDETFRFLDANEDGRLSGKEMTDWEFCDADGDKRITAEEFQTGLKNRRIECVEQTPQEIQKLQEKMFRAEDVNNDGRLSGTEVYWFRHYDLNADKRVTLEEYVVGNILDSATVADLNESPADPVGIASLQKLVDFLNSGDADTYHGTMHDNLKSEVEPLLLKVLAGIVQESHGTVSMPDAGAVRQEKPSTDGQVSIESDLTCEKGPINVKLVVQGDLLTGFLLKSAPIDDFNAKLFEKLSQDKDFAAEAGQYYSRTSHSMIELIMAGNDDDAFLMFHPEVQQQLKRKDVDDLFAYMRNGIGEVTSMEFTELTPVYNNEAGEAILVVSRVIGTAGTMSVSCRFQFTGMKASVVGLHAVPVTDDSNPQPDSEVARPEGAGEDDGWQVTAAEDRGFHFWMPGTPERSENAEGIISWILDHEPSSSRYLVQSFLDQEGVGAESEIFFETLKTELAKNVSGEVVSTADDPWNGNPSRRLILKTGDGQHLLRRDILIGDRVFAFQWVTSDLSDANAERFGNPFLVSFSTTDATPDDAPPAPPTAAEESSAFVPAPVNFGWLPPQPELVLNVRPSALMQSPFLAKVITLPEMEKGLGNMIDNVGFSMNNLDSVTVGLSNVVPMITRIGAQAGGMTERKSSDEEIMKVLFTGSDFLVVLRFHEDTDLTAFLTEKGAASVEYKDTAFLTRTHPKDEAIQAAFWQPDPKTCIVGGPTAVKMAIDSGEGESTRESFAFIGDATHLEIAAASPSLMGFSAAIPVPDSNLPPILGRILDAFRGQITAAGISAGVDSEVIVKLKVVLPDEAAASDAEKLLNEGLILVREFREAAVSGVPEAVQPAIREMMESLTASSEQAGVVLSFTIPNSLVTAVSENPDLLKPAATPSE
jgi:hypothetical protein